MKKNKKAFTIVELMTAMSIVGIASFLVIPMAVKSFNKHQSGIVLGRATEQIYLGNQNIIQLANTNLEDAGTFADSLDGITEGTLYQIDSVQLILGNELGRIVRPFWNLENDPIEENFTIRNFANETLVDSPILAGTKYNFSKIQASISITGALNGNIGNEEDTGFDIYIDTNGFSNSPNTYGRDIFAFHLIKDGTLRPFVEEDDESGDGLGYTEQVVREGFKITYY